MFEDMIANMRANKKLTPIVAEFALERKKTSRSQMFLYNHLIVQHLKL